MKALYKLKFYTFLFLIFLISGAFYSPFGPFLTTDTPSEELDNSAVFSNYTKKIYDSCGLKSQGLSFSLFEKGITGFYNIKSKTSLVRKNILTIADFQKSSKEKRLWVIDLDTYQVLFNTLVAHGKNTGEDAAVNFSDVPNSNMSSLGFYYTSNTYQGKHGLSLVLEGLDKGFNSKAKERSIVMHGAEYVCEEFVQANGRLGRSHGCPAVPAKEHAKIIHALEGGTILFIYHSSAGYHSIYLDPKTAADQFLKENNG